MSVWVSGQKRGMAYVAAGLSCAWDGGEDGSQLGVIGGLVWRRCLQPLRREERRQSAAEARLIRGCLRRVCLGVAEEHGTAVGGGFGC